jgi:hypothetical protein
VSDHERPDPRDRPADPAGTQPKVDAESLRPEPHDPLLLGRGSDAYLAPRREANVAEPAPVPRETEHTPRFQFLLGALLAVGAVALAGALAVALRPAPVRVDPAAGWSSWRPLSSAPVGEIAKHIGRQYRLPSGRQLALVKGGPMAFLGLPAQVVLQQPPKQGGDISLLSGQGVIYRLCGLGSNCSISEGKPSTNRMFLLRREALELALYTFRYISNVNQVVVFLPPGPSKQEVTLLLRKDQLAPLLLRPVTTTLARRTPSVKGVETSPDASNVDRLTRVLYTPQLAQSNADASLFLVLKPFDPKAKSQQPATQGGGSSGGTSTGSQDPSKALSIP